MSLCCWTVRHEAAGYECQTEAMLGYLEGHSYEEADALAAAAGYDVSPEQMERDGGAWYLWEVWGDVCLLDAGHAGPHEFTRTRDIVLDFAPLDAQADGHFPVGAEQGAPRLRPGEER